MYYSQMIKDQANTKIHGNNRSLHRGVKLMCNSNGRLWFHSWQSLDLPQVGEMHYKWVIGLNMQQTLTQFLNRYCPEFFGLVSKEAITTYASHLRLNTKCDVECINDILHFTIKNNFIHISSWTTFQNTTPTFNIMTCHFTNRVQTWQTHPSYLKP